MADVGVPEPSREFTRSLSAHESMGFEMSASPPHHALSPVADSKPLSTERRFKGTYPFPVHLLDLCITVGFIIMGLLFGLFRIPADALALRFHTLGLDSAVLDFGINAFAVEGF